MLIGFSEVSNLEGVDSYCGYAAFSELCVALIFHEEPGEFVFVFAVVGLGEILCVEGIHFVSVILQPQPPDLFRSGTFLGVFDYARETDKPSNMVGPAGS